MAVVAVACSKYLRLSWVTEIRPSVASEVVADLAEYLAETLVESLAVDWVVGAYLN